MKLTFLGAAHEVTGSCFFLEACGKNILIDCGMEQGPDEYENQDITVSAAEIDYVLLTHAHIDHSGLLPLLYAKGFRGVIHSTNATADLCDIMLRDSAHIQEFEAEWRNRKGKRAGKSEYIPLYTMEDAEGVLNYFCGHAYSEAFELCPGIRVNFVDVGHLLGSSSIEVWIKEGENSRKIVFSGDIGNHNQPLIKDPQYIGEADFVVMESTYGDRLHIRDKSYIEEFAEIIETTLKRGGNVVIPSFAVGRTQELLYFIRKIKEQGLVHCCGDFPVYMDSPLAIEATSIFHQNVMDCYDDEARELVKNGINPISFSGLHIATTSDESKEINFDKRPKVIISASGMCEAGRIKHHLKHNLWRPECTILFAGYQAVGTLGRNIIEGVSPVKLFGEEIEVCAEIKSLHGISAHADRDGLYKWVDNFSPKPKTVFVVHGENTVCDLFAQKLHDEHGLEAVAPYIGSQYDLLTGMCINEGVKTRAIINKKARMGRRAASAFDKLLAAGKRLLTVISRNEGCANKDLSKFTDQINSLCDKWDR